MVRVFMLIAAMLLMFSSQYACAEPPNGTAKDIEYKIQANKTFVKAARQIVEEGKAKDAMAILKMAEQASAEGAAHLKVGEYEFALEDIHESTQMAIHAIVLTKNGQDAAIRGIVMQEELALREKHDMERKEKLIRKGIDEVEIFIKTAERLLAGQKNDEAAENLNRTRELYKASKQSLANGRLDESLEGLNKAYQLATKTVKEIKKSQGDIITFPKPIYTDEKQHLAYELKKNDSYSFFAVQLVNGGDPAVLKTANETREQAMKEMDSGDVQKAIERLKASTDLYIKAIKDAGQ